MSHGGGTILVLNAGSSSIKAIAFGADMHVDVQAEVSEIGSDAVPDHAAALALVMNRLKIDLHGIAAVAHRVVHGGTDLTSITRITPAIRDEIAACTPLAPLHNPHHLAAIDWVARVAPDLPQYASFDTAFHATIPDTARRYAIPEIPQTAGLRRYGFHGNSYAAMVDALRARGNLPRRLLAFHLGNGASACAILDGQSVATTMGFSPLAGLTMGTRSGDIDPGAVLELARRAGVDAAETLLNKHSGLLGLSGLTSDMRMLQASEAAEAAFAIEHFCHWAARHAAALIPAMGGVDIMAFTGGIGENAQTVREKIHGQLAWLGDIPAQVVPAAEEAHIARQTATLLKELQ